jgi:hypothetical protein
MSLLLSFLSGAALAAVAAFGTGFLKKAGEDFYGWGKIKVRPPPPQPVQVASTFEPTLYPPGCCGWQNSYNVHDCEALGWTYYPHPKDDAKCYRIASDGRREFKEFLMVKPGSAKTGA